MCSNLQNRIVDLVQEIEELRKELKKLGDCSTCELKKQKPANKKNRSQ